jgi:proton glutamate symport protein
MLKKLTLTHWIFISLVVGIGLGFAFPEWSPGYQVLSNIFLRLIKSIIAPILFGTLVVGIAGHTTDMKQVGRLALKSVFYFEIVTSLALLFGLVAVNTIKPGVGIQLPPPSASEAVLAKPLSTAELIEHIFPKSIVEATANNDVLQIVFFAVLFGLALSQLKGRHRETMIEVCESLSETMFKFTGMIMKFAPIGVGAAMANTVSHSGADVLLHLAKLVVTLYLTLFVFIGAVFVPVMLLCRIPIRRFVKAVREPALIAFTTTSSDAALPDALQNMVKFGVPKRIVSFVLPLGYSFNLDGSTLYLALASVFCAQAAGIELTLQQQLMMMLSLMVSSKGVAAVPRASFVILSATLVTFGIPIEAAVLILGVDTLMDMARTCTNLVGNCLASAVMARWEGDLRLDQPENIYEPV